jgi:holo-ACP synthase
MEKSHLETGSEALLNTSVQAYRLKSITVQLEEDHPLGRLFDMDVVDQTGRQITRAEMNLPTRRCFICDEEAKICARNRTHRLEDLLDRISSIAETYFNNSYASRLNDKHEVSL